MKSVNNFAVTGFVGQDAKINKFNNASVARFGLYHRGGLFQAGGIREGRSEAPGDHLRSHQGLYWR